MIYRIFTTSDSKTASKML